MMAGPKYSCVAALDAIQILCKAPLKTGLHNRNVVSRGSLQHHGFYYHLHESCLPWASGGHRSRLGMEHACPKSCNGKGARQSRTGR